MIRAKGVHSRMRRSRLPDASGARELIADGRLPDSLARGGKYGITQHRRNRRKTRLAHAAPRTGAFDCRLSRKLGITVQDAGESGGDLARLQRLGEQLADTRDERLSSQGRAAITAHQHDRQVGPPAM